MGPFRSPSPGQAAAPPAITAVPVPYVANAPPAVGADGKWQGVYACSGVRVGMEMTVNNGEGSYAFYSASRAGGGTAFVKLRVSGDTATFYRTFAEPGGTPRTASLSGRLSGSQISATGDENGGAHGCSVSMARTGGR